MAGSSGRFPCMPLTSWGSRLLRKGGGWECSCFVHLLFPSGIVPGISSGSGKLLSDL